MKTRPYKLSIKRFRDEFFFLSNFYPLKSGKTLEHIFQWCKTFDEGAADLILNASSPGKARRLGREAPLRKNWEDVKLQVMEALVCFKFLMDSELKTKLLETGDAYLEEGNNHGDRFWGTVNGKGKNHLGKILMKVRRQLRELD